MATEEGVVIKSGASTAWVKTERSSACKACSARGSCTSSEQSNAMEVEALNVAGAQVGDRIVLHIETSSLLKASFLLYVFPILCMLAGALVGHHGAEQLQIDPSVVSLVLGLLGFGLAFVIVRRRQQAMAQTDTYKPKVIRIVQRAPQNELRPAPLHQG